MALKPPERTLVTPSMARQWLDMNAENNRAPKKNKIAMYARDMKASKWESDTGETIKFDEDARLIDGQNRLRAVMLAGVPVEIDVQYGLPRRAMSVLDSGSSRTAADTLKIANATDRMRMSSIVRWVIMWDGGLPSGRGGSHELHPSNTEILDRFQSESGAFDAAARRGGDCQHRKVSNGSVAGVAYYLFARLDVEKTQAFFDQFVSGANLPDRSPILALRERLRRTKEDRITRPEQLALFMRAWNAWRKDQPMSRIAIVKGELTNANFPKPK